MNQLFDDEFWFQYRLGLQTGPTGVKQKMNHPSGEKFD